MKFQSTTRPLSLSMLIAPASASRSRRSFPSSSRRHSSTRRSRLSRLTREGGGEHVNLFIQAENFTAENLNARSQNGAFLDDKLSRGSRIYLFLIGRPERRVWGGWRSRRSCRWSSRWRTLQRRPFSNMVHHLAAAPDFTLACAARVSMCLMR